MFDLLIYTEVSHVTDIEQTKVLNARGLFSVIQRGYEKKTGCFLEGGGARASAGIPD